MTITINLPFPNGKLSPNRAKGMHWGATSSLKGRQFDDAYTAAYQAISTITAKEWTPLVGRTIPLTVTFNEPDRRMRDLDNLLAAAKSAIDGIATALTVNDKHFSPITVVRGEVVKGGQMIVEVA
jgi:crossover junction endodeoxyribonuclease RusA